VFDRKMSGTEEHHYEVIARGFDDTDKTVCMACITGQDLRAAAEPDVTEMECSFCEAEALDDDRPIAAPLEAVLTLVMDAVGFLYWSMDSDEMPHNAREVFNISVYDSTDVVSEVCSDEVSSEVLEAMFELLHFKEWTDTHIVYSNPDEVLRYGWESFCDKVKYTSRFVFLATPDQSALHHPDELTATEMLQRLEQIIGGVGLVQQEPAARILWRGRLAHDQAKAVEWNNAADLGAPPRDKASNNRMSPAGIAMFYGSDDIDTVVAEIGSHSTKRYAVVGTFETTKPMNLLNLVDLPPTQNVFSRLADGTTSRFVFYATSPGIWPSQSRSTAKSTSSTCRPKWSPSTCAWSHGTTSTESCSEARRTAESTACCLLMHRPARILRWRQSTHVFSSGPTTPRPCG
jgi:HEPN/RES N-terminal domain 1/RES domain